MMVLNTFILGIRHLVVRYTFTMINMLFLITDDFFLLNKC